LDRWEHHVHGVSIFSIRQRRDGDSPAAAVSYPKQLKGCALAWPGIELTRIKHLGGPLQYGSKEDYHVSMKVNTRQVDGVTILDLSGRITLGEGSVQLRDVVRDLLSKGNKQFLVNLADVNYIDSSGIGELMSAYTSVRNQGGEVKLLHLTKKVHDLLQITKLYTVFRY
jgi:anti-sigma B factor antagonist